MNQRQPTCARATRRATNSIAVKWQLRRAFEREVLEDLRFADDGSFAVRRVSPKSSRGIEVPSEADGGKGWEKSWFRRGFALLDPSEEAFRAQSVDAEEWCRVSGRLSFLVRALTVRNRVAAGGAGGTSAAAVLPLLDRLLVGQRLVVRPRRLGHGAVRQKRVVGVAGITRRVGLA